MKTVNLEQLLELDALVITETDGSSGLRDLGRLEVDIATQTQEVFDEELYGTIFDKAAAIIRGILQIMLLLMATSVRVCLRG